MRFIGDIHGNVEFYRTFLTVGCDESIQVGDFGIGFHGDYWHEKVAEWQKANPAHKFIRGNHDDPARVKTMPGYIKDGSVINTMMLVGGAYSIDKEVRLANNWKWWEDEQLSYSRFQTVIDTYAITQPSVMVTHDCPHSVAKQMFFDTGMCMGKQVPTITGQALDAMFSIHQPKLWVFGHYHTTMQVKIGNTIFACVGADDYLDFNLEDFE